MCVWRFKEKDGKPHDRISGEEERLMQARNSNLEIMGTIFLEN